MAEIIDTLKSADNESTRAPYWMILDPRQNMRSNIHELASQMTGPFFSRKKAEIFLKQTRYNFGPKAHVYCLSGCHSQQYYDFCDEINV